MSPATALVLVQNCRPAAQTMLTILFGEPKTATQLADYLNSRTGLSLTRRDVVTCLQRAVDSKLVELVSPVGRGEFIYMLNADGEKGVLAWVETQPELKARILAA